MFNKIVINRMFNYREITNDDITGRYKFINGIMYIEVKAKPDFIESLLRWNWNRTVWECEIDIEFENVEYFTCGE